MADVSRDESLQAIIAGGVFVYSNRMALAPGGTHYSGILIGPYPLLIERRNYGTDANDLMVNLYEDTTYSGGVVLTGVNRNRTPAGSGMPEPQSVMAGVTPGALPAPLFSLNFVSTDQIGAGLGDPATDRIVLAAGKSYVFSATNNDATTRNFAWSWLVRSIGR